MTVSCPPQPQTHDKLTPVPSLRQRHPPNGRRLQRPRQLSLLRRLVRVVPRLRVRLRRHILQRRRHRLHLRCRRLDHLGHSLHYQREQWAERQPAHHLLGRPLPGQRRMDR